MVLSKEVTWSDLGPKRDDPGSHVESRPKLWAEAPTLVKDCHLHSGDRRLAWICMRTMEVSRSWIPFDIRAESLLMVRCGVWEKVSQGCLKAFGLKQQNDVNMGKRDEGILHLRPLLNLKVEITVITAFADNPGGGAWATRVAICWFDEFIFLTCSV